MQGPNPKNEQCFEIVPGYVLFHFEKMHVGVPFCKWKLSG